MPNSGLYVTQRMNIWNSCIKQIAKSETLFEIKISKFKKYLRQTILETQNKFDFIEWYPDQNFML